jgi:heat shock protein HtpX
MSNLKAYLFLLVTTIVIIVLGDLIGGYVGIYCGILVALLVNVIAFFGSDKVALNLYHAKEIDSHDPHNLRSIVKSLVDKANVRMPSLYVVDTKAANLFVTGRNHHCANIAITTGLLELLTPTELTGALAQMVAQIQLKTLFLNSVITTAAGFISGIANIGPAEFFLDEKDKHQEGRVSQTLMAIVAPIAALIVRSVIYPRTQFEADRIAVTYCDDATGLISALEKIQNSKTSTPFHTADSRPATAQLFLINPIRNKKLARLFRTHPPTEERIKRLAVR